jgi:triphosphoribosyl-dephospho-CoA synthetase
MAGEAIVEAFLTLLARTGHRTARRKGPAEEVQRQAALAAGRVRQPASREAVAVLDQALRDPENRLNPGATADLTTGAIFFTLLDRGLGAA